MTALPSLSFLYLSRAHSALIAGDWRRFIIAHRQAVAAQREERELEAWIARQPPHRPEGAAARGEDANGVG